MESNMDQIIHRAVYLQQTSPNFATFCVAHVQDPNYQFLFQEQQTSERRLYLRLMEQARQKRGRDAEGKDEALSHLYSTGAADGLFTVHDVTTLWQQLRRCSHNGDVHGPHLPLPFCRKGKLRQFLQRLVYFAEHSSDSARDQFVEWMMRHLPMTETFHRIMCYVFRELIFLLHAPRAEEVHRTVRRLGEPALSHLLELFTAHLYAHKRHAHHKERLYYGKCFEHFGAEMLTLCAREIHQLDVDTLSVSFFSFCQDVALTWSLDFTQEAAAAMEELGGSFETHMRNRKAEPAPC